MVTNGVIGNVWTTTTGSVCTGQGESDITVILVSLGIMSVRMTMSISCVMVANIVEFILENKLTAFIKSAWSMDARTQPFNVSSSDFNFFHARRT
jgi:hypothetical protein